MALLDFFKSIGTSVKNYRYAKFLNGYTPTFSQFGEDIYASDVVQNCIDRIATEVSKLNPKHIRVDRTTGAREYPVSSLNRLFEFGPNELMTTKDFLEKVTWQLMTKYNAFILPVYNLTTDGKGNIVKEYSGFYPLAPYQVDFIQDLSNKLFVKLYFSSGDNFTIAYSDIIHLRKKFSSSEVMGGGLDGLPDNAALLKVLQINDTVMQGIAKGIKTSMAIRGVLKMNSLLDEAALKAEREKMEERMFSGDSAIIPAGLNSEFVPISIDPKMLDKDTMDFLQSKILHWFGVSVEILSGKFTDDDYQAFYETTLEPIIISLGQAFSKCIFTDRQLDVGNRIVFYQKDMMYLNTKTKLELLKTTGEQGLLTDDQKLEILGYPPLADGSGSTRTRSLNFIDTKIINQYQLNQGGKKNEST